MSVIKSLSLIGIIKNIVAQNVVRVPQIKELETSMLKLKCDCRASVEFV
jgi:hypothetical protein